ncbi:MAG: hypothetical protein PHW69_02710 [Elusimicrobiaceae bacterium]|nr:hypothetical protein [Elusimicrobiaceae bacterium]
MKHLPRMSGNCRKRLASIACAAALLCAADASAWWGYAVTAGAWRPDAGDMETELAARRNGNAPANGSVYRDTGAGDLTVFLETNREFRLGFSLGYGLMAQAGLNETFTQNSAADSALKITGRTAYFPLTLYGKYKPCDKPYSLWLGGGLDWIMADSDVMQVDSGSKNIVKTFSSQIIAPAMSGGAEWFLSKHIALGVTAKYVFSARTDEMSAELAGQPYTGNYKMIMRGENIAFIPGDQPLASGERLYSCDYGGFRAALELRAYFGGPDKN